MSMPRPSLCPALAVALSIAAALVAGCNSSASTPAGGTISDALDNHCEGQPTIIPNPTSCMPEAGTGDAGAAGGSGGTVEMPAIMYNSEGDDDDCKYHVSFVVTPLRKDQNATFNVTLTRKADGAPSSGADVTIESYLAGNFTHPIPNSGSMTSETPPDSGKYVVGPVRFDASGLWVVRFHFYERCFDTLADSPHGHASFYVNVP